VKYIEERNKVTLGRLDEQKRLLPPFCASFFLGIAQTTSPLTRLNYAYDLGVFFDFLTTKVAEFVGKKPTELTLKDLEKVDTFHIELFADTISKTNGERAKCRKLSALRSFFAYYFKRNQIEKNIMPNVDLPKIHDKNIIRLDGDEVKNIVELPQDGHDLTIGQKRFINKNGFRDKVILTFFLSTGIRVSELVGLNIGDIDLKNGTFRATRKGGNETILFMTNELCDILRQYIGCYDTHTTISCNIRADVNRPLFVGPDGKTRLGVRSVQNLVKKYARVITPLKKISPHKLRSTFGTNLYRATGDIYAVADVLGHANVNTTRKHYAEITADVRRNAISKFESKQN